MTPAVTAFCRTVPSDGEPGNDPDKTWTPGVIGSASIACTTFGSKPRAKVTS
jgi:hypothetical protein